MNQLFIGFDALNQLVNEQEGKLLEVFDRVCEFDAGSGGSGLGV